MWKDWKKCMKKSNARFPMFVDLWDKKILVVGGGTIAGRRIRILTAFAGDLTVVAPRISPEIRELAASGAVKLVERRFCIEDVQGAWMVLAATDDPQVNRQIWQEARAQGAWVNVSSDRTLCDFHFPGIIRREPVVIGINASGENHRLAREVREELEKELDSGPLFASRLNRTEGE